MMSRLPLVAALSFSLSPCLLVSLSPSTSAQEKEVWPQFLGPNRNGVSNEKGHNLDWDKKKPPTVWKVPVGSGYSSFAVVGDRLYTTAKLGDQDGTVCLDASTGKQLWAQPLAKTYRDRQGQGSGPRGTPTYADGKLYCLMPMGGLFCLEADGGKVLWKADTFKAADAVNPGDPHEFYYWGVSQSPLVEGGLVIVQPGGQRDGSVVAFDAKTGAKVWGAGGDPIGYGSPVIATIAGKRQVVAPTGQSVLGIDPADGKLLWRYPFGNKFNATGSNPVWTGSELIMSAAYGGGVASVRPAPGPNGWEVRENWKSKKNLQSLWATSVVHEGHVYGISGDLGAILLKCLDLKSGDLKWDERLPARSSMLAAEGHLLILDERGTLHLVEMSPKGFVPKGSVPDLMARKAWAAPALAGGRLYLRDERNAVCLDLRR